ncbi:MAG: Two component integral rane sensor signal transduction histidine kinase [Streptosporangiaceae bacterium]|nr:Two component integral rane sensor signal transduction histidine kinase [Streptosporangiaceae bacterium]
MWLRGRSVLPGRWRDLCQDLTVGLSVSLLLVIGSAIAVPDELWLAVPSTVGPLFPTPGVLVLLLVEGLSLTFRRVAPLTVLLCTAAASLAVDALDRPPPLPLGVLVAVYTVAVRRQALVSIGSAAGYLAAIIAGIATGWAPVNDDHFFTDLMALTATVTLGYGVALSRTRARLAERIAAELAHRQEARTRAAVEQEQARFAREVHDMVAHDVSVIVAQASAARRGFADETTGTARTLSSIEAAGRDALDGLRRLIHLLRTEFRATDGSSQPALDDLPVLLARVRRAGLPVELLVRGAARRLPEALELNAYRIIQESLTNTLKHAGPSRATVLLHYEDDMLDVEIRDDGADMTSRPVRPRHADPGEPEPESRSALGVPGSGYGLTSMRERAALLGGELVTGDVDGRGFRVAARFPVGVARS